jgi:hypothetical protein
MARAWRGSYEPAVVVDSGARSNLMEDNGALSNPQARVELVRLAALCGQLRDKAAQNPRSPRSAPVKASPVLGTVTRVLEDAGRPMRARDIHRAAEQHLGQPVSWASVRAVLSAYAIGGDRRFRRIHRGTYELRRHRDDTEPGDSTRIAPLRA